MNPFITEKIVTTTKKVINPVMGGSYSNCAYVSIVPISADPTYGIDIVIGAPWEARCASFFSKKSLGNLIADLKEVYEAMED